ncbi:MAG: M23 family metallopeptidase [Balneola sp.]
MKRSLSLILYLLCSTQLFAQSSEYLWPTNSGRFLSSTFGETRSAHFHAGLDIKTWGREGYKVYASKDGILSQLLTTNKGYGKAIYLKHNDGSYTVYAHLQRFNTEFQKIADSVRLQDYSYTMDEFLEPRNIEVKQGDVIGYTGSTGIGPPHLHFEIRDKYNQPLNPLQYSFEIKDTLPPVFSSILVEPLSPNTKIDGLVYPKTIYPQSVHNDTTYFDTVYVTDKFGIAPNIYDEANSVTNKYAPYRTSLNVDNEVLFIEEMNSFNFSEADKMFMNRIPAHNSTRRTFQRLFINDNITHPFLVKNNPVMHVKSGSYVISTEDYFGNKSIAVIPIEIRDYEKDRSSDKNDNDVEYWTNDWISINDSTNVDLRNFSKGALWDSTLDQRILNIKHDINYTISRLEPNKKYKLASPDHKLITRIEPYAFFDTLSIIQNWDLRNDSIFVEIGKEELPIRKEIYTQIQVNDKYLSLDQTNLYSLDKNGAVSFVESWISGSTLHAYHENFGKFVVLTDSIPPRLSYPKVTKLGNGTTTYKIRTQDELSGIDYKTAIITVNGNRGIPEYDYENDTFTFYLPNFTPSKMDTLQIKVKDKAGNSISKSYLLKN